MKPVLLDKFKGLRNDVDPTAFEPGDMAVALNVDIEETGKLQRRSGFLQVRPGSSHSLWAQGGLCFFVSGGTLYRLKPDMTAVALASGLADGLRASYTAPGNGLVYWANGVDSGVTNGALSRPWGIQIPDYQPLAAEWAGELFPGVYQFALTFVGSDGRESGAGLAGRIEIEAGGISFAGIWPSDDPSVTRKNLYLTTANGEQLYLALTLPNDQTSALYTAESLNLQVPLETQFLMPPPPGQFVSSFMGRALVAVDNLLFVSTGAGYELFNLLEHYAFGTRINMIAPMIDGCFIGTEDEVLWASGREIEKWNFVRKHDDRAVPGTLVFAPSNEARKEPGDEAVVAMWTGNRGIYMGMNGGTLLEATGGRYSFDAPAEGAGLFRAQGSLNNYVAVLAY